MKTSTNDEVIRYCKKVQTLFVRLD